MVDDNDCLWGLGESRVRAVGASVPMIPSEGSRDGARHVAAIGTSMPDMWRRDVHYKTTERHLCTQCRPRICRKSLVIVARM